MSTSGSSFRLPREPDLGGRPRDGSSSLLAAGLPPIEDPTVISSGPPLVLPRYQLGMHPLELGQRLEGERLGHFLLEKFIGGGGMGVVFRAMDTMLNRIVAVKVLSTDQAGDEDTQRRFKNEAQSAARLDHDNIARVYYVGEDRGVQYIVFEHIEGVNIRDLVDQHGPLALIDAVSYTLQISEALGHASQRDVVHRDIKPSNVLITPEKRAKLVDMGLARLHQVEHSNNDLTASGVTLGTFDYISPEQARDPRTADVRSDLYSLGCTFYFMLTGRPPFPDGTVLQKLLRHQADEPPEPREFRPDLPTEFSRIVAKLLAKSPAARYQSPADLIADLLALCDELGISVAGTNSSPAVVREPSLPPSVQLTARQWRFVKHLPWLAPVTILLVAVFALDRIWSSAEGDVGDFPKIRQAGAAPHSPSGPVNSGDPTAAKGAALPGAIDAAPPPGDVDTPPAAALVSGEEESSSGVPATFVAVNPINQLLAHKQGGAELGPEALAAEANLGARGGAGLAVGEPNGRGLGGNDLPTGGKTGKTAPKSTDKPMRSGILVVSRDGEGSGVYRSLQSACDAVESGDVIELRYDGPLVERPLVLSNSRLTIRAGDGYAPSIVFRPNAEPSDPAPVRRSMLAVVGGELALIGVHLLLEVPRELAADNWTLIEARGADALRLDACTLTIRNGAEGQTAYHQGVAIIEVKAPPGSDGMGVVVPMPTDVKPLAIRLEHCIARGEATFLKSAEMQAVDLLWENGLLVTSEPMLLLASDNMPISPRVRLQADLRHLTMIAGSGLLRMENRADASNPIDVKIKCRDCILLARESASLVEQRGEQRIDAFKNTLSWNGNRVYYEGFSTFWRIGGPMPQKSDEQFDMRAWQKYWDARMDGDELQSRQGAVVWRKLPPLERPLSEHVAADYALERSSADNPALGAATDGRDVGMMAESLPSFTAEITPVPPEPAGEEPTVGAAVPTK